MSRDGEFLPPFRLVNYSPVLGAVAYFDIDVFGLGRIRELVYAKRGVGRAVVKGLPLAMARDGVHGELLSCPGRRSITLAEEFEARLITTVEGLMSQDKRFLDESGFDQLSEVFLPSARDIEEDWDEE